MAEFIGDQGFLETIVDDTRRPGSHKAQWTEAAERELEMLVMRKETVWYKWDEIIKPSPDLRRKHTHHLQRDEQHPK